MYKTINDALKHISNEIKRARYDIKQNRNGRGNLFVVESDSIANRIETTANDAANRNNNNNNNNKNNKENETLKKESGHVNLAMDCDDDTDSDYADCDDDDNNNHSNSYSKLRNLKGERKKASEIYETLEDLKIDKKNFNAAVDDLSSVIDF